MTTYLLLSCAFIAVAVLAVLCARSANRHDSVETSSNWVAISAAGLALLILTAVFDNIMIAVGLFTYADDQTSGIRLGLAPIEDFSYPLAAVILLPALWRVLGRFSAEGAEGDR